jgi:hypothetical protein
MRKIITLACSVVLLATTACQGQVEAPEKIFRELKRTRGIPVVTPTQRYDLVNNRFELCRNRRQHLLMREMTYAPPDWAIRVLDRQGRVWMRGQCADPECKLPYGDFFYFDEEGTLRARGWYTNGVKCGTWQRWDAVGRPLADKHYAAKLDTPAGASRFDLYMELADR